MSNEKKITLRLHAEKDSDLITWLDRLNLPYGQKGETIKNALRRGIKTEDAPDAFHLDTGDLLAEIRQVVEATLSTQLANLSLAPNTPNADAEEDEYTSVRLDQLGDELLFDPDDDDTGGGW